ncbi:MAG: type II toxin-antitoxin system VapB family antitoxin [Planctomycetes bacterium]|nr:type II toxin-antitoxin system VapB family antitoxin [Planctomycetota bacterium]
MKRTNVVLDEELVGTAKTLTGIRTTRQVVDHALRELVRHRRQRRLLSLKGRIHWEGSLDEMRRGRIQS